jgi:hypothetical protein
VIIVYHSREENMLFKAEASGQSAQIAPSPKVSSQDLP